MGIERKIQQRTLESRKKLLNAAYNLFVEKGYYNTNTKEIARNAGISIGNYYNYYKDKGEIYCALLEEYSTDSCKAMQELVDKLVTLGNSTAYKKFLLTYLHELLIRAANTNKFFEDSKVIAKENIQVQIILLSTIESLIAILEVFLRKHNQNRQDNYYIRARMIYIITDQVAKDILFVNDEQQRETYTQCLADEIIHFVYNQ